MVGKLVLTLLELDFMFYIKFSIEKSDRVLMGLWPLKLSVLL